MVDRCICANITFASLKKLADERSLTLDQLKDCTGACTQCSMCEPYLRLMFETGRTTFVPLTTAQIDAVMSKQCP